MTEEPFPPKVPIRLLIVDDHEMVRTGLKFFFASQRDLLVVGEASGGPEALLKMESVQPDVVLMDIVMADMDGIEVTRQIKCAYPAVNVLMITSYIDEAKIAEALYAGASGYVMKNISPRLLAQAVHIIADGGMYIAPEVTKYLRTYLEPTPQAQKPTGETLTEREQEVLELIGKGCTNQEISTGLQISEKTVKVHVSSILRKMGFSNRTQAALYLVKKGTV